MKAVILAAGEGTRLRPITYYVPKLMLPFYEKPFMAYTMENLSELVESVVMVVNYKQEQIRDYFGEQFASLPVEYVVQSKLEGTASAVMAARDFVDTKFLVVQGDVYASRKLLKEMAEIDSECALSLVKVDDPENHAGVRHQDGQVLETFAENEWVDRGIWLFSPTLFDYIEKTKRSENDEFRMLIAVQKMIDSGVYVSAYLSEGPWIELGDHEPLESVLKAIAFLQKKEEELEDSSIASEIDTQHCSIKNSLIFGEGRIIESRISNSVVYLNGVFKNQHVANEIVVLDKEVRRN